MNKQVSKSIESRVSYTLKDTQIQMLDKYKLFCTWYVRGWKGECWVTVSA